MPYYLMFSFLILTFIYQYKFQKSNIYLDRLLNFKLAILVFFLFVAFRGNGNGDYQTYIESIPKINSFDMVIHKPSSIVHFEIGFRFIAYIVNTLNLHPQFVLIAMNAISFYSVYYFINKYSLQKELSLCLFFSIALLFDMHHSRSAVGISLGLLVYDAIVEKRYIKSLMFVLIAVSFHKSSFVLLILYPILLGKTLLLQQHLIKKINIKILVLVILIIFFHFYSPIDLILTILNNPITGSLHNKLASYFRNDRWSYQFRMFDPRLLLMIFTYLTYSLTSNYKNKNMNFFAIIQLVAILLTIFLSFSTILVIRTYSFFNIFSIVLIPNMLIEYKNIYLERLSLPSNKYTKVFSAYSKKENIAIILSFTCVMGYFVYTILMISMQFEYFTVFRSIL